MLFRTFSQLFNFREFCLCGSALSTEFISHQIITDDDYIIRHRGNIDSSEDRVKIPCSLESRLSPYGESDFDIIPNLNKSSFKLKAEYCMPHIELKQSVLPAEDFVRKHLTKDVQKSLNLRILRRCAIRSTNVDVLFSKCSHDYQLLVGPIIFNMQTMMVDPFEAMSEHFMLAKDNMRYYISTSFKDDLTDIKYSVPDAKFILGKQNSLSMSAKKFMKYPWSAQFLTDKVRTLLLFS